MKIRIYDDADYDVVANVWKRCFSGLRPIDSREAIRRLIEHSPGLFLVAEIDSTIAGTVFAGYDGRQATVHRLAVLPEYQQEGVGTALMKELLERLASYKPIEIVTDATPEKHVVHIFETFGFEHTETKHMKMKIH